MTRAVVRAAIEGDRTAFVALIAEHRAMVCGLALAIVGEREASEDVAQDVFVATWNGLPRLRDPDAFRSWLRQTTRNRARQHLREVRRRRRVVAVDPEATDRAPDPAPPPIEALTAAERDRALAAALADLGEDDREVLVLFYREGSSVAAVASALGLPEVTVRKRLSRARARLRSETDQRLAALLLLTAPTRDFPVPQVRTPSRSWRRTAVAGGIAALALVGLLLGSVTADRSVDEPTTLASTTPVAEARPAWREVAPVEVVVAPAPVDTGAEPRLTWPDLDPFTRMAMAMMENNASSTMQWGCLERWAARVGADRLISVRVELDGQGLRGFELPEEELPPDVEACVVEVMTSIPWPPLPDGGVLERTIAVYATVPSEPVTEAHARQQLDEGIEGAHSGYDALVIHRPALEAGWAGEGSVTLEVEGARSSVTVDPP